MDTSNIINNPELTTVCATEYFATLLATGEHFPVAADQILRNRGYRDYDWVRAMLSTIVMSGILFPHRIGKVPSAALDEVEAMLSREAVAQLCLADNILVTMYHEYVAYYHQKILARQPQPTKDERALARRLSVIQTKFRKLKETFLSLAFDGRLPRKYQAFFSVEFIDLSSSFYKAFAVAPLVYRAFPRYNDTDFAQILRLRQRYRNDLIACEKWRQENVESLINSEEIIFKIQANGKF